MEAVHEGRVPLIELAGAFAGREQRRIDTRVEIQQPMPDHRSPFRWNEIAHLRPVSQRHGGAWRRDRTVMLECCGKPKAYPDVSGGLILSSRAELINQWSRWPFQRMDRRQLACWSKPHPCTRL